MNLRNLPTQQAQALASLIEAKPGQVSSKALTAGDGVSITLLAFAANESVSEEQYFGDTLYYVVEGACEITMSQQRVTLQTGQVLMVPALVDHAVENVGCTFKLLQITVAH